jgi:hypothetical protein
MGFRADVDESWKDGVGFVPHELSHRLLRGRQDYGRRINRRLREDGYDVPLPEDNSHAYGFHVDAPGGFTVELGA